MRAAVVAWLCLFTVACSTTAADAMPTPSASSAGGPGQLDPAVSLPSTFPGDFPVYPGARPTQQTAVDANGTSSWEVTWETFDSVERVQAFYTRELKLGDWTITSEVGTTAAYTATFQRKSSGSSAGLIAVNTTTRAGLTTISAVLTAKD